MMVENIVSTLKQENGATAIIVGLLVTAFIGFLAVVADVGYMYETRRQLQSAADAAALAGMAKKIDGGSVADVLDEARYYALKNDFKGDRGTPKTLEMYTEPPFTEVTDDYVRVTVRKTIDLFFAPIFALINQSAKYGQATIAAQAKAKRVYVTGIKGLLPWGFGTIKPQAMEVTVNGVTSKLEEEADGSWSTNDIIVPTAPGSYAIDLTVYNSLDWPQVFEGIGTVVVHDSGDSVSNVTIADYTVNYGSTAKLNIESAVPPEWAKVGGVTYSSFSSSGNLYQTTINTPDTDKLLETFAVDIRANNSTYTDSSRLIVRKPNSPIGKIDFGRLHFAANSGERTSVTVTMDKFEYGKEYTLKQVTDPEAGNFMSLDFSNILHNDGVTQEGLGTPGYKDESYFTYVRSGFYGTVHIGDAIMTQTGNGPWPKMETNLDYRSLEPSHQSFADWEDAGRPANCRKLLTVPIVEFQKVAGKSYAIVKTFAVFYLTKYQVDASKVDISGVFVKYAESGSTADEPPDSDFVVEAVRLDKPTF